MSYRRGGLRWGALALAGICAAATPLLAFALPRLEAFSGLERGRWEIREAAGGPARFVCFRDPVALVQLEHREQSCAHEVLASESSAATVQYTCQGRGFGHTSIRVETPRIARIETQGLIDGRPFSYRVEARRVGGC